MTLLALALGATAEEPAYKTHKPAPFYYQRASLFEILPADTTDIIMLGNSITNGCEWHESFPASGDQKPGYQFRRNRRCQRPHRSGRGGTPGKDIPDDRCQRCKPPHQCRLNSHRYHHCCRPDSHILPQHQTVPSILPAVQRIVQTVEEPRRQTAGNYRPQHTP